MQIILKRKKKKKKKTRQKNEFTTLRKLCNITKHFEKLTIATRLSETASRKEPLKVLNVRFYLILLFNILFNTFFNILFNVCLNRIHMKNTYTRVKSFVGKMKFIFPTMNCSFKADPASMWTH